MEFTSHGYYRNRAEFTYNLDTQMKKSNTAENNNRFGVISFNEMRLRLEPGLKLNDFLSVHVQMDILDDIVFGSSDTSQIQVLSPVVGTITLPAGAGSISMVGGAAGENGSVNVRRAWAEILTPVGKLKFGRQPSHWGLGIFQNDGNGIQADFGDSADRIMFITQKQFGDSGALSVGALWDIAFEAQFDPRIQGLGGEIRDNGQDTNQWAGLLLYERPEGSFGIFGGIRKRDGGNATTTTAYAFDSTRNTGLAAAPTACGIDGDTLIYFLDTYARYSFQEYNLQAEFVYIGGKMTTGVAIDAVPLGTSGSMPGNPQGVMQLPAKQPTRIFMAAFEADAKYNWGGEWGLKAGYAEGDANPLSSRITQYGFRPDYQIALLMFDMPLGTSPKVIANAPGMLYNGRQVAGGLPITGNFINNAIYVAGTYKHHFDFSNTCKQCNDFSTGLRVVTAFADKTPVMLDFATILNDNTFPTIKGRGKWYGVEADLLIEGKFFDYLYAALEGGLLLPGSAYNIDVNLINNTMIAPISSSKASLAYAARLTLMLQF